jgi:hypothetical protein
MALSRSARLPERLKQERIATEVGYILRAAGCRESKHDAGTQPAACNTSFTLSYIILGSNQVITENFSSAKAFRDSFHGFRFTNPTSTKRMHRPLYLILLIPLSCTRQKNTFLTVQPEDYSHNQISDKAFEDKPRNVLER